MQVIVYFGLLFLNAFGLFLLEVDGNWKSSGEGKSTRRELMVFS
jgi:hypothetical protein